MKSIFREVTELRNNIPLVIDRNNANRYRLVCNESDRSKTAYYFGTPIYNINTRKIVDFTFKRQGDNAYYSGSNANITVSDTIRMENNEGHCSLQMNKGITKIFSDRIECSQDSILPTTNGVVYKIKQTNQDEIFLKLSVAKPFMEIRANDRCFSLMSERFKPFVTLSCIGTLNSKNDIVAPVSLKYQKTSDREYILEFKPSSPLCEYIMLEINMYEPKLLQDTTVESLSPKTNNAFGSIAFLGSTEKYGEQWLYSRIDYDKLVDAVAQNSGKVLYFSCSIECFWTDRDSLYKSIF